MRWEATASQGRHRTSEPHNGDDRTDTIAISKLSATYGRHAAPPANHNRVRPVVVTEPEPAEDDALAPVPDIDAESRRAAPRLTSVARYLRPRAMRRSA